MTCEDKIVRLRINRSEAIRYLKVRAWLISSGQALLLVVALKTKVSNTFPQPIFNTSTNNNYLKIEGVCCLRKEMYM
jgi:hypothetical protein